MDSPTTTPTPSSPSSNNNNGNTNIYEQPHNEWKAAQSELQQTLVDDDLVSGVWSVADGGAPATTTAQPSPAQGQDTGNQLVAREAADDNSVDTRIVHDTVQAIVRSYGGGKKDPNEAKRKDRCCMYTLVCFAIVMTILVILLPLYFFTDLLVEQSSTDSFSNTTDTTLSPTNTLPVTPTASPTTSAAPTYTGQTRSPTVTPTTAAPSQSPTTLAPTVPRNLELLDELTSYIAADAMSVFANPDSPYYQAYEFLLMEDSADLRSKQRFGVVLLDKALRGNVTTLNVPECQWLGVVCNDESQVTHLAWSGMSLSGRLPLDVDVLPSLTVLDLGDNDIAGNLPNRLYHLIQLQELHLLNNHFSGWITEDISKLTQLRKLLLNNNQFQGVLPQGLGSPSLGASNVRPLEWMSVGYNHFTGPIPEGWNLRNLFYLDIGHNALTGRLPLDWSQGSSALVRLRNFYADHNQLTGTLPSTLAGMGKGRLNLMTINNNTFTGAFPGGFNSDFLNVLEIHDNDFSSLNKTICDRNIVFNGGEMVMLRADCGICDCNYFCRANQCY